jgi:hypothetical protein
LSRKPSPAPRVFEHLSVAGGVVKRGDWPAPNHEVNALGLAGVVVVKEELGVLGQDWFAILVIAVLGAAGGPDDLLRRYTVDASE